MTPSPSPASRRRSRLAGVAVLAAAMAPPAASGQPAQRSGPPIYPETSNTAESLLGNADNHARGGQWNEAVSLYIRVLGEFGSALRLVPKDDPLADPGGASQVFMDIREYCQRKIAALPPEGRAEYRRRADGQAGLLYRQGAERRDEGALRKVAEESFCSSFGDDAWEAVGDLAYQDGRFDEAVAAYRHLVPDDPQAKGAFAHPDPSVDLPRVAAKKLLCRAALGEDYAEELGAFAARFGNPKGKFAGREGPLAEILSAAIKEDGWGAGATPEPRWPTFAGSPSRTLVAPEAVDLGMGSFQWREKLSSKPSGGRQAGARIMIRGLDPPSPSPPDGQGLAFHPIILGDQVLIADDQRVISYPLNGAGEDADGVPREGKVRELWKHEQQPFGGPTVRGMSEAPARYTLTAHDGRIFARLGPSQVIASNQFGRRAPSMIVALDLRTQGKQLWKVSAAQVPLPGRKEEGANLLAGFEGTPVADDRGVYVAVTEGGNGGNQLYVACLDPASGAVKWVRFLFQSNLAVGGNNPMAMMGMMGGDDGITELEHRLLTVSGATVYYQTNLGAVAALDAVTGRIRWLATYPRRPVGSGNAGRDLNPAIVEGKRVYVAPKDSDAIFAFDVETGRLAWQTSKDLPIADVVHLLGVSKGKLIATGNHVYFLDAATGGLATRWPQGGAGFTGYGRGVLAGDAVYWPTRSEIHVLDQSSGLVKRPPIKLGETFQATGGNLAVGDGFVAIAQEDYLVVYCQNKRLIKRYRDLITRSPGSAGAHYRLAQALEREGIVEESLASYAESARRARGSDLVDGRSLRDAARDQGYRLRFRLASRGGEAGDWAAAARWCREAAEVARTDGDRLPALLKLAEAQEKLGKPADAAATLQGILAQEPLQRLSVTTDASRSVRADLLIAQRLGELIRDHGRGAYARFDAEAADLLAKARGAKDVRMLQEVERAYPAASVVPDALLALAGAWSEGGHPGEAAATLKRLLGGDPGPDRRAMALWELANAYEAQKNHGLAREALGRIVAELPDVRREPGGEAYAELAAARLSRPPLGQGGGLAAPPFVRLADSEWPEAVDTEPVAVEGEAPSRESGPILLAKSGEVRPIRPGSEPGWSFGLDEPPIWAAYLDDRLLLATGSKVVALELPSGKPAWTYDGALGSAARPEANPFARLRNPSDLHESRIGQGLLEGFRVQGGRVFFLRGKAEFVALDGATGQVDWTYSPAADRINRTLWVGPNRIVLQARDPHAIVLLDPLTGRRPREIPQGEEAPSWLGEPIGISDRLIGVVLNRQSVAAIDVETGGIAWSTKLTAVMPPYDSPRLFGDARALLALVDGRTLVRLDPASGDRLWECPLGQESLHARATPLLIADDRVYVACDGALRAIALGDGRALWVRPLGLPARGWSVELIPGAILAWPDLPRVDPSDPAGGGPLPIVTLGREDGRFIQRLAFPASRRILMRRDGPTLMVATGGGAWTLGPPPAVP